MVQINAAKSSSFKIGGEMTVNRLGFGAMRITGPGIWGPPADRAEALRAARLPELGVNFIDTADSYGPDVVRALIREALHPYDGILVATKAGFTRPGPDRWVDGRPEYLTSRRQRACASSASSRSRSGSCTASTPRSRATSSSARSSRSLLDEGIIRHAGLARSRSPRSRRARNYFPVATVQNRYNLVDRASEDVLDYCERDGIGFIPWFPLGPASWRKPARRSTASPSVTARRRPDRAGLAAEAQPGDAADSRHLAGGASRGERRGGEYRAVGRGIQRDRSRRAGWKRSARAAPERTEKSCTCAADSGRRRGPRCPRRRPSSEELPRLQESSRLISRERRT